MQSHKRPVVYWYNGTYTPGFGRQADLPAALSTLRSTAVVCRGADRDRFGWNVTVRSAEGEILLFERHFPRYFGGIERRWPAIAAAIEWCAVAPKLYKYGFRRAVLIGTTEVSSLYSLSPFRPRIFDLLDPDLNGDEKKYFGWLRKTTRRVDAFIVTAAALAEDVAHFGKSVTIVPNACHGSFLAGHSRNAERNRIAAYLGTVDQRVDLDLLAAVVELLPDVRFEIGGRVNHEYSTPITEIAKHDNVTILGPLDAEDGRRLLERASVGIIPFATGWVGDRINPVKSYEYQAAGLPVVASDIAECRELPLVDVGRDAKSFAAAICRALEERPAPWAPAMEFAQRNRWDDRAALIDASLSAFDEA